MDIATVTTEEAANELDLTYQGLMTHVRKGNIASRLETVTGKLQVRVIEREELERFKANRPKKGRKAHTSAA